MRLYHPGLSVFIRVIAAGKTTHWLLCLLSLLQEFVPCGSFVCLGRSVSLTALQEFVPCGSFVCLGRSVSLTALFLGRLKLNS